MTFNEHISQRISVFKQNLHEILCFVFSLSTVLIFLFVILLNIEVIHVIIALSLIIIHILSFEKTKKQKKNKNKQFIELEKYQCCKWNMMKYVRLIIPQMRHWLKDIIFGCFFCNCKITIERLMLCDVF